MRVTGVHADCLVRHITEGVNIFNFRGEILMNGLEPTVLANKCAKISNMLLNELRDLFWNYHCYLFLCCVFVCIFNGPNFRKVAVNGNAGLGVNFWGAGGPWVAGAQVGVVPNVAYPIDR